MSRLFCLNSALPAMSEVINVEVGTFAKILNFSKVLATGLNLHCHRLQTN
jgi:hypothetical protein